MELLVLGVGGIAIWLAAGFVARCMCKYRVVKGFVACHPREFPSLRHDVHDPQAQGRAWRWHSELAGFLYLLSGPVGLLGALMYAAMDPLPNGEWDVRFLL